MSTTVIIINDTNDVTLTDGPRLTPTTPRGSQRPEIALLAAKLEAAASGIASAKVGVLTAQTSTGGTAGTATITLTSNPSNGDTVTIAGVVFTFATTVTDQASNPTSIPIGASTTVTSASLATQLNLHPTVRGLVKATAASNVTTLTENFPGLSLTYCTIAKSGANITISGAALTGAVATTFRGAAFYGLDNP